ncbi:hypothetical protein TSOC_007672, partial [Tetrabaena socialis]
MRACARAGQACLAAALAPGGASIEQPKSSSADDLGSSTIDSGRSSGGGDGGDGTTALLYGSGDAKGVRQQLREALLAFKWADMAVVAVEVVTLLFSCLLHSAYMRAADAAEDAEEGRLGSDPTVPLITPRRGQQAAAAGAGHSGRRAAPPPLPPRVQRNDPWSRRMREQYGLDTSTLSYDPVAAAARGAEEGGGGGGGAAADGGAGRGGVAAR